MVNEQTSLLPVVDNSTKQRIRNAFENFDAEASKQYHDTKHIGDGSGSSEEHHKAGGGLLKPIIFGGLDGILTSFAIVAASAGANLPVSVVLIIGFSNIFADALSMGVGEFLSSKAENEWILSERDRETWELENYEEGEKREMVELFVEKGMDEQDAKMCIDIMSKYKDFFVDIMMAHELELQVPEKDHVQESFREGIVMFCSFAGFGAMPLLGYVIFPSLFPHLDQQALFTAACVITGSVLFLMGSVKSFFCCQAWWWAGTETLLLGGACATVAYTVGQLVQSFLGEKVPDL